MLLLQCHGAPSGECRVIPRKVCTVGFLRGLVSLAGRIGSILTGGDKMAIAWRPADEDVLKLRFSADYLIVLGVRRGGACLHVIQCIILLITYSITKYTSNFGHICTRVCGARLRPDTSVIYGGRRLPRAEKGLSQQKVSTSTEVYGVQPKVYGH